MARARSKHFERNTEPPNISEETPMKYYWKRDAAELHSGDTHLFR
jgi:hypothetical protein